MTQQNLFSETTVSANFLTRKLEKKAEKITSEEISVEILNEKISSDVLEVKTPEMAEVSLIPEVPEKSPLLFASRHIGKRSGNLRFADEVQKFFQNSKQKYQKLVEKQPAMSALFLTVLLMGGVGLLGEGGNMFKASLVESPVKFDGTVMPFAEAPNWFKTGGKNNRLYSDYSKSELVSTPRYDVLAMRKDVWEKDTVNSKITYPIVYSGKYVLNDFQEYTGSHPAVDIKLPTGTPVFSIAAGLVTKVVEGTTGFGNHIVVRHDGVPQYGTVYSSYSHLSKNEVRVGQVVEKGEKIGEVGSTGSSTTPHIHFQIDKKEAPYHPYWPYTSADAKAAGVSYSDAVTAGVGKENVTKYTLHPIEFVYAFENGKAGTFTEKKPANSEKPVASKTPEIPKVSEIPAKPLSKLEISVAEAKAQVGDVASFSITALDADGKNIPSFAEKLMLVYSEKGEEKQAPVQMNGGMGEKKLVMTEKGNILFLVKSASGVSASVRVNVKENPNPTQTPNSTQTVSGKQIDHFVLDGKTNAVEGEKIIITAKAVDASGNLVQNGTFQGGFVVKAENGSVNPNVITQQMAANGLVEIEYTAGSRGNSVVQIDNEMLKISVDTKNSAQAAPVSKNTIFPDVADNHKHAKAIAGLKAKGILNGYDDGSFRPDATVSRAEVLKMLFSAFKLSAKSNIQNPFPDVPKNEWFAPYVISALDMDIAEGYPDGTFLPARKVNRSEYFKFLLNAADVKVATSVAAKPFSDVPADEWFAPYAEFAKQKNLLDFGGNFGGANGMTRGEVAETLWRMQ